jgi:hypothetical protein
VGALTSTSPKNRVHQRAGACSTAWQGSVRGTSGPSKGVGWVISGRAKASSPTLELEGVHAERRRKSIRTSGYLSDA